MSLTDQQSANQAQLTRDADAWRAAAESLATWTQRRQLNRAEVWGRYGSEGTFTAPAVRLRGQVYLDFGNIVDHYRARRRDEILGLHTTSPDNTCLWCAVDIDRHGDGNDPAATLAAALYWHGRAKGLGFRPLLTGSNGAGGYHLRILFREAIPAPLAYSFARWLTRDHERHGLPAVETFPKQPQVGKCGNWLRLPGRHHRRDYWSEVYDGARWLSGAAAVELIPTHTGDGPNLIPREAHPVTVEPRSRKVVFRMRSGDGLPGHIEGYMRKLPHYGEGQGRDGVGYNFARFLVRDLALTDDAARPWLKRWDDGNNPPKGDAEITKWLASARAYGQRAYGCGLAREEGAVA